MRFIILLAMVFALSACSEPTVDSSSDTSMQTSIQKVRDSLPQSKRSEFDDAIKFLMFSKVDFKSILTQGATGTKQEMMMSIHGKTGKQVIEEASRKRSELEAKQREQALKEIAELVAKKSQSSEAEAMLAKFEIIESRFYKEKSRYRVEPVIDLKVKNGTDFAVSRAFFVGTIASPGRAVPWLVEDFNYEIAGGLEPGEETRWRLAPNAFGKWGRVDIPADAVFTVKVKKLNGADGEPLFGGYVFTEQDQQRLDSLQKQYMIE